MQTTPLNLRMYRAYLIVFLLRNREIFMQILWRSILLVYWVKNYARTSLSELILPFLKLTKTLLAEHIAHCMFILFIN
jgi:hypothetical protein